MDGAVEIEFEDLPENRAFLRRFPLYTFLPRMKGFRIEGGMITVSFEEVGRGAPEIGEDEFAELFKSVYEYAANGFYIGRVSEGTVYHDGKKTVLLPSVQGTRSVSSGRIENDRSFFATIGTLSRLYKNPPPTVSKIARGGIPEILKFMGELSLEVLPGEGFLPSFGVWRHSKLLERLSENSGFVHLITGGEELFSKELERIGRVFHTVEEVKEEILRHEEWKKVFRKRSDLDDVDPSALAFLFPVEENNRSCIFDYGGSIEMNTVVHALHGFRPRCNVIAVHEGFLKLDSIPEIEMPRISPAEFGWFLRTFFGSETDFRGDVGDLFERTGGEIFSLSKELVRGRRRVENGRWQVEAAEPKKSGACVFLRDAVRLSRTGKKPYLGLQLVSAAHWLSGRELEVFGSLSAFFHKVLGEYESMKEELVRADSFGVRSFRNAYYSVVLSMNGIGFSLSKAETSVPLVEISREYARLVSDGEGFVTIYNRIVRSLEPIHGTLARRVETMARNYVGILDMIEARFEKAVDEFETALVIARDNGFGDLIPLIETNIGRALSDRIPELAYKRLSEAFRESVAEGLWKIAGLSDSMRASMLVETGNFKRVVPMLAESRKCTPSVRIAARSLRVKMQVEDLDFSGIDLVGDRDERDMLRVVANLYSGNGEEAVKLLKKLDLPEAKSLLEISLAPLSKIQGAIDGIRHLGTYFTAGTGSPDAVWILKNVGAKIYGNNFRKRAIFYEEQLAKAYSAIGLARSADYHLGLAAATAGRIGLNNRASKIAEKIETKGISLPGTNGFLNSSMLSWGTKSARDVLECLAADLCELFGRTVRCDLMGSEEIHIAVDPDGEVRETDESAGTDLVCSVEGNYLKYRILTRSGEVYVGLGTEGIELDDAVLTLDRMTPLYVPYIERNVASRISNLDQLTGVYTRRHVMNRLNEEIERAGRYDEILSVAMVDIDDFKKFNDSYGHDTGDAVLKKVTKIVRDNVRNIDIVGRYGGEEFLIIFPHTGMGQAFKSCERIRKMVGDLKERMPITISIGVAEMSDCSSRPEELVKCADMALYMAKSAGKDHVTKYSKNGGK